MVDLVLRKRKQNSYSAGFILKVISFSEESKSSNTSRQFRVYEKLIPDLQKGFKASETYHL